MESYQSNLSISVFELASLILQGATLGVLYFTLRAVLAYTRETRALAEAAVEQIPRPIISLRQLPDATDDAVLEHMALSIRGFATIQFRNVGTGHAVNFRYQIRNMGALGPEFFDAPEGPALGPGEVFETNYPRAALSDPSSFIAEYESLGGARYRSRADIEGRAWVRNFRFEKI